MGKTDFPGLISNVYHRPGNKDSGTCITYLPPKAPRPACSPQLWTPLNLIMKTKRGEEQTEKENETNIFQP